MKNDKNCLAMIFDRFNISARHVADAMGNLLPSKKNIAMVLQAVGRLHGLKGVFELAAQTFTPSHSGTTGRPFKPFRGMLFKDPELIPH